MVATRRPHSGVAGGTDDTARDVDPVDVAAHATGSASGRAVGGASYAGVLVHGTGSAGVRAGGVGETSAAELRDTGSAGVRVGGVGEANTATSRSSLARAGAKTPDAGEIGAEADADQVGVGFRSHAGSTCACGQADCSEVRALLDSGANPIISGDPSLFESFDRAPRPGATLTTASGKLAVTSVGTLFARIGAVDSEGKKTCVGMRAPALYCEGLKSDTLLAVSSVARCNGCSVVVTGDGEDTALCFEGKFSDGGRFISCVPESKGVYPLALEPLSDREKAQLREEHPEARETVGKVPQFFRMPWVLAAPRGSKKCVSRRTPRAATANAVDGEEGTSPPPPTAGTECGCSWADCKHEGLPPLPAEFCGVVHETAVRRKPKGTRARKARTAGELDLSRLAKRVHDKFGHVGSQRLAETLETPGEEPIPDLADLSPEDRARALRAIRAYRCPACQRARGNKKKRNRLRLPDDVKPFELVHIDLIPTGSASSREPVTTPLDACTPHAQENVGHILLAVDQRTRYTMAHFCPSKRAVDVANAWFALDGEVRDIMEQARLRNKEFAEAAGYTEERIRDRKRSIIPNVISDGGGEFEALAGVVFGRGGFPNNNEPLIVRGDGLSRWYNLGGGPVRKVSDLNRKYENGLVERRHQTVKTRAFAMCADAGLGLAQNFASAYVHAARLESLAKTSVPQLERRPDSTITERRLQQIPFNLALGYPYPASRPRYAYGSLAFPLVSDRDRGKFTHRRAAGLFLGIERYPSRNLLVAVWDAEAGRVVARRWSPETTVLDDRVSMVEPLEKRRFLMAQRTLPADDAFDVDIGALERRLNPGPQPLRNDDDGEPSESEPESDEDDDDGAGAAFAHAMHDMVENEEEEDPNLALFEHMCIAGYAAKDLPDWEDWEALNSGIFGLGAKPTPPKRRGRTRAPALGMAIRPGDGSRRLKFEELSPRVVEEARQYEVTKLVQYDVLHPVWKRPGPRHRILATKTVHRVKPDQSLRSRVTVKGFLQLARKNYFATYAAVASPAAIRLVVAFAASFGVELQTADFESAYLQADMTEEVYTDVPPEIADELVRQMGLSGRPACWRLNKALYGSKQAARLWRERLHKALSEVGFLQSTNDRCFYYSMGRSGNLDAVAAIVVDDVLAAASDEKWAAVVENLTKRGVVLDKASVGHAQEFNGMEIRKISKHHYELGQQAFITEMAEKYDGQYERLGRKQNKVSTPLSDGAEAAFLRPVLDQQAENYHKEDAKLDADPRERARFTLRYQSLLGSLMWLSGATRPDLAFVTSAAGSYSAKPGYAQLKALEHALAYVVATRDRTLVFNHTECKRQMDMTVFTDSDFAGDGRDLKSRSGVICYVNNSPIFWTSKKQTITAGSSTAAETIAANLALRHVRMYAEMLTEVGIPTRWVPMMVDNTTALMYISGSRAPGTSGAKHLGVMSRMLEEAASVEQQEIWPVYCSTHDNVADVLTKGCLSGKDAEFKRAKWEVLEKRARGDTPSPGWIDDLLRSLRPAAGKGAAVPAVEIVQPMTSVQAYFREARRGRTYPEHFGGALEEEEVRAMAARLGLKATSNGLYSVPKRINILEIFCGENHSAIRALRKFCENPENLNIVTMGDAESLDIEARCNPSVLADVRSWRPLKTFKRGHFDLIWCSIPCPEYSRAKNGRLRNLPEANEVGLAAIKAMFSLEPRWWVIENPTGLLREQAYMQPLKRFLKPTSYCKFGFNYRGETDIWTNVPVSLPHCRLVPCDQKRRTGRHAETKQRGPSRNGTPGNKLADLHRVPLGLIGAILEVAFLPGATRALEYLPRDLSPKMRGEFLRVYG